MPTYQYACTACEHRFERVQSFTDDPLIECPECAGRLRKVFNSVGIVFKGSGFYRTDSREKPATSPDAAGDKSTSKPEEKPPADKKAAATAPSGSAKSESSTKAPSSAAGSSTAGSAA